MTARDSIPASSECELLLDLLSRHKNAQSIASILRDAQEIRQLLHLYSFRSSQRAETLYDTLASRYRKDMLAVYGSTSHPPYQTSSVYLRLEQLLSLIARAALLHLCRSGDLPFSKTQLTQSNGMLLHLLRQEMQQKTGG